MALTEIPIELSSTPGIVDNSNATAITIDSSENVGIGTAPISAANLHLSSAGETTFYVDGTQTSDGTIFDLVVRNGTDSVAFIKTLRTGANDAGALAFGTQATGGSLTERMRIDSSGNLLVGRTSRLTSQVKSISSDTVVSAHGSLTSHQTDAAIMQYTSNAMILRSYGATAGTGEMVFKTGGGGGSTDSEAMRIDSSGNLLVGKTSTTFSVVGVENRADGRITSTRSGNTNLLLNRLSSDGDIVQFYKDGTQVGSIGTEGGDSLYIQSGTTSGAGLHMHPTAGNVNPARNGAKVDAAIDLGRSSHRFKDLYLSGSITSGANGGLIKEIGGDTSIVQGAIGLRINDFASALSPTTGTANNDGNVDLGISNVRFKDLHLSGNATHGTTPSSSAAGVFTEAVGRTTYSSGSGTGGFSNLKFINGNGTVGTVTTSGSATAYNTSSDYRLKENVVAMSGATERLKQLKPSRFNFIADADTTVDGFLAHEVQDIVPEAISGTKDAVDADGNPEYQGIDQSKLVPLLVATIQELEARITQLES